MIVNPQAPLHRLLLSLSEALDLVHPKIADHQLRVTYMALRIGQELNWPSTELFELFKAGTLHDIGLIRLENRLLSRDHQRLEQIAWHGPAGYELLKDNALFARAARMVRYHHVRHDRTEEVPDAVPLGAEVLHLADEIERWLDRDAPPLLQSPGLIRRVRQGAGSEFHPDVVEAFAAVAATEAFWLDVTMPRVYSVLLDWMNWPMLVVDEQCLTGIGEIFARVVDSMSVWTACHTAGVAGSAVTLAEACDFSPREVTLMRAAAYFHDLGKLAVPAYILDKPGKLTDEEWAIMRTHTYHTFRILNTIGGLPQISEWAAFHHERLDGAGYPFHHTGRDLTLGSRIMAVADVFTALVEDRPYRAGMDRRRAAAILERMADTGALDGDVVAIMCKRWDGIDSGRRRTQEEYGRKQRRLAGLIDHLAKNPVAGVSRSGAA